MSDTPAPDDNSVIARLVRLEARCEALEMRLAGCEGRGVGMVPPLALAWRGGAVGADGGDAG